MHIVPVIICVDDGGSLPIARATRALVERAHDTHDGCHDLSQIATQRGAYRDMRADSTSRPTERPTIVGLRSGTVLDPKLVAEFRAVAARTDIAHRVLMILESGQGTKSLASAGQHRC